LRIYGVLQRIAICFLLGVIVYLLDRRPSRIIITVTVLLAGYWILMRWIPVPGYGLPGRDIPFLDKNANLAAYFDRHIFPGRLYEGTRDPEGALSTIPALATTLLGVLTGIWLRSKASQNAKCVGMLSTGIALLCLGEFWSPWFPINKNLWTSSYVLLSTGIALLAWGLCSWAIEVKGWTKGWTVVWLPFGVNAITAYMFSELFGAALWTIFIHPKQTLGHVLYAHVFSHVHPAANGALLYSACVVIVCWLPMAALYRRGIILKV
jgi:predicted acyltransferase